MYVPVFNRMSDGDVRPFLAAAGAAELVTTGEDGYPRVTLLPFVPDGPVARGQGRLLLHMARANPHWRSIGDAAPALAVVGGAQAYVSPSCYASKVVHGRVVPTWNYSAVHLRGRVTVRDDEEWKLDVVQRLTDLHEAGRERPWGVADAPADYVRKQLKAIVGLEFVVETVEAKAKLSQNRDDADHAGVLAALASSGLDRDRAVAADMGRTRTPAFVLHDHRRPRPHHDLRLEEDGVLRSWALPRGLPTDPAHDRLAVHVDDHDLGHLTYTDEHKSIADIGRWELHDRNGRRFTFTLHGRDGSRRYALIRTDRSAGRDWLLHLTKDQPVTAARRTGTSGTRGRDGRGEDAERQAARSTAGTTTSTPPVATS